MLERTLGFREGKEKKENWEEGEKMKQKEKKEMVN